MPAEYGPLELCRWEGIASERGFALLVAVVALALFSLLGLYTAFNAAVAVRISDNYESEARARFAAYAGLDHARAAMRGVDLDDLLKGPDGTYDPDSSYLALARTAAFRNPLSWSAARTFNTLDPAAAIAGLADDGTISTGRYQGTEGVVLISQSGVGFSEPDPSGTVEWITARYFVKVTDNNQEAAELAGDPLNNPFIDGDGLIVVRSLGAAPTIRESLDAALHDNSIVVFEGRYKRRTTFNLDAPLVLQGKGVTPSLSAIFSGDSFLIQGGEANPAIGTIDVDRSDATDPAIDASAAVAPAQRDNIIGNGLIFSIRDLTAAVASDADRSLLLAKDYLWNFTRNEMPGFSDNQYSSDQDWTIGAAPDLGYFDAALPANATGQRPRVTFVEGNLTVGGNLSGAGLLVVTGKLTISGAFSFKGLILVIGSGDLALVGPICSIAGGVYIAAITNAGEVLNWGLVRLSLDGASTIGFDPRLIKMAIALIPPVQVGFREVTSSLDP